jgi:hypothetical protein
MHRHRCNNGYAPIGSSTELFIITAAIRSRGEENAVYYYSGDPLLKLSGQPLLGVA